MTICQPHPMRPESRAPLPDLWSCAQFVRDYVLAHSLREAMVAMGCVACGGHPKVTPAKAQRSFDDDEEGEVEW